jgi:2-keto-4-pentenoate hydratase
VLFADMARTETEAVDMTALLQPRIEAEVAFVLGAGLDRADLDLDVVCSAVGYAVAALEIVDSRIAGWDISLVDTFADNASSGLYVLGAQRRPLAGLDLREVTMTMTAGDEAASEGTGAACLGDPCAALLWLARTARDYGWPLRAGDLVLSGALGPMVPTSTMSPRSGWSSSLPRPPPAVPSMSTTSPSSNRASPGRASSRAAT